MDVGQLRDGLLQLILLIISIGLHEFGHAWMADRRGDPLPRLQGRVTLNPFAHTDPIGTIALPAIMIFLSPGFGLIGWGKPVQISLPDPKTRRMDDICITLAGPAMNLVLCFGFAVIGGLGGFDPETQEVIIRFLAGGILLNAGLVSSTSSPFRRWTAPAWPCASAFIPRRCSSRSPAGVSSSCSSRSTCRSSAKACMPPSACWRRRGSVSGTCSPDQPVTRGLPNRPLRAKVGACKPSANASKKPVSASA